MIGAFDSAAYSLRLKYSYFEDKNLHPETKIQLLAFIFCLQIAYVASMTPMLFIFVKQHQIILKKKYPLLNGETKDEFFSGSNLGKEQN